MLFVGVVFLFCVFGEEEKNKTNKQNKHIPSPRSFTDCGIALPMLLFFSGPKSRAEFFDTFLMSWKAVGFIQHLVSGSIFLPRLKLDVTGFYTG